MGFVCSQCGSGHERVFLRGGRRKRGGKIVREYRCAQCGHVGFSNHQDLAEKEKREKPPDPIKFDAALPVVAYNGKWCHKTCDGWDWSHDGDHQCAYWGEYLNTDLNAPMHVGAVFKRCQKCLDSEANAKVVHGRVFPKFVRMNETEMNLVRVNDGLAVYDRAAGAWSILAKWSVDKLLVVGNMDARLNHLTGTELVEITEEEHREGNAGSCKRTQVRDE